MLEWPRTLATLEKQGWAVIRGLVSPAECRALVSLYDDDRSFRSRIVMARHGIGRGEFKYFSNPLPDPVGRLRTELYPALVPLADVWNAALKCDVRYPARHGEFIQSCHQAGQMRPTSFLQRLGSDDYHCLVQDVCGEQWFPLQVMILLAEPLSDFTGGEFVLSEQRSRLPPRVDVIPMRRGDAVVFATQDRPERDTNRTLRVTMRHGVSAVRTGCRHALGIVFHDSR